jgi:hypothetical protein
MDWKAACNVCLTGSNKSFDSQNIVWKGGAWTGRGLAYVAEVPIVGDFLDGMMLGYAAQRGMFQQAKAQQQVQTAQPSCAVPNPA